jgi:electron transfer flavoprotein alpha subunit
MSTVRPGVFPVGQPQPRREGETIRLDVELQPSHIRTRIAERVIGEGVDLTQVPVLVCGGRGMDGDFATLAKLAEKLGGDVGGTRPPVDEGHIPRERQVGQTGVVCRPKVALTCGISGAFHFVVGIQDAGLIASINIDPEAPIFEYSDYYAVADAKQVLPELFAALEAEVEGAHV